VYQMKCTKCGGVAVVNMPQHRLKLCNEHFVEWFPDHVARTIHRHDMFQEGDRILVAVSGGKDSLALWAVLQQLGHITEGVHIHLGIDHESYSDRSQEHVEAFAEKHGLSFQVVNVAETYGHGVPALAKTTRGHRMCSACGLVKRHIMNRIAYEGEYAAIATGHNCDDEAAILMQNTLHWQADYLRRQAPVLPQVHPRLARKVKPLCRTYERDVAAYALVCGIDYIQQECPFSAKAQTLFYKEILNKLERHSPATKQRFYVTYLKAKEEGLFAEVTKEDRVYNTCSRCGQPTLAGDLCSFCRLWEAMP